MVAQSYSLAFNTTLIPLANTFIRKTHLFSQACILNPQVLLVERHLPNGGWATTVGAGDAAKSLLIPNILRPELLILVSQLRVLISLVLRLRLIRTIQPHLYTYIHV